ncbi:hypothetical protein MHHHKEFG_03101 [Bacillus pumilus]|jgi:hypothetical protein|nr:hypothetical protein BEN31_00790 [Bacillus pumilus]
MVYDYGEELVGIFDNLEEALMIYVKIEIVIGVTTWDFKKRNIKTKYVQDGEPADTDQHLLRVLVGVRFLFVRKEQP